MSTPAGMSHVPVLIAETLDLLAPQPGEVAVDCTLGRGGHAEALAGAVGSSGRLVGFDLDPANVAYAGERLAAAGPDVTAVHGSFADAPRQLAALGLRADVVLADLGFASTQMDDPERGFSFSAPGPLDMRLDTTSPTTAADLLASATESELADIIYEYGEDPFARRIARKLAQERSREPIRETAQLARLVREAYGSRARSSRMHPATRTFMALRIALNDELGALDALLAAVNDGARRVDDGGWLAPGARIAIISFHSLEDRRVKRTFVGLEQAGCADRLTRKPVVASAAEIDENPRARSAKLRAARIAGP